MGSTRRCFTDEYKRHAVSLILDGGHTIGEVAKKLEISVRSTQPPWRRAGIASFRTQSAASSQRYSACCIAATIAETVVRMAVDRTRLSRVVAIANGKGAVGKISLATTLAGLAATAGYRILLIDLDPQATWGRISATPAPEPVTRALALSPLSHRARHCSRPGRRAGPDSAGGVVPPPSVGSGTHRKAGRGNTRGRFRDHRLPRSIRFGQRR